MSTLDLGVIGNSSYGALISPQGRIVWSCLPRFDGDPVFCDLLNGGDNAVDGGDFGFWEIDLADFDRSEQNYEPNTAILKTRLYDKQDNAVELTDFAPRYLNHGRMFRPVTIMRRIAPLIGTPRITIRLRPRFNWGARVPDVSRGTNHVRFFHTGQTLRLNTNAPLAYVLDEVPFLLEEPVDMMLGPDEPLAGNLRETANTFEERTADYWRTWVRRLALPLEWQDAVIRAAITLKLCTYEETGAIIAAMTTSVPEAANTQRNWDYRYCWLRDAFFVVRALNSLSEVETMEHYLRYLHNIVGEADDHLQPVWGISREAALVENEITSLSGYRGMGPVRVGNQAYEHFQHDVYGNVVLAASQSFLDQRLFKPGTEENFSRLEHMGELAFKTYNQPDAGMWELRTRARVHTSSSLMCWAACDRLAKIARHMDLTDRATYWQERADIIHSTITSEAWNEDMESFAESFGGKGVEAGLLLMAEVGFLKPDDERFQKTLDAVERTLKRGKHMYRYAEADDFGEPETAFNICTFWYIDALARVGREEEAREIFEEMLSARNTLGLLSEDTDVKTGELWGNYPQTYSLVGIINAAMRLSRPWEDEV
ncbi:MAG: glycoside hydrolase family 15 protein [Pseudomonadota bacterium]